MTSDYNELAIETFKLHMRIKEEIEKLKNMKSELLKKMKETKKDKLVLKEGYIKIGKWKSSFSSTLNKEFKKIDENKKKEFLLKGLLKLQYKLNTNEYQLIKNKKESSELDEFVIKRDNNAFLRFQINEQTKSSKTKIGYSEDNLEYLQLNDEFFEEIMEEIKPDPVYLEDDDPADMSDEEKNYKGYD
tara:strand:- start:200 stop:763 length:564 start_codon:yes stop_codon:yes gene_type:complete